MRSGGRRWEMWGGSARWSVGDGSRRVGDGEVRLVSGVLGVGCGVTRGEAFEEEEGKGKAGRTEGREGGRKGGRGIGEGELYQQTPDQPQSGDLLVFMLWLQVLTFQPLLSNILRMF